MALRALLCFVLATVSASLPHALTQEALLALLAQQETTIRELQAALNECAITRDAALALAAGGAPTGGGAGGESGGASRVAAASASAFRAEVMRYVASASHAAAARAGSGGGGGAAAAGSDAEDPFTNPLSVHLACAGEATVVTEPLPPEDAARGACLALSVTGGDVAARFVLHCGEEEGAAREGGEE
jgi:AICAR transformylase/IMP cyclohydrolase PurH